MIASAASFILALAGAASAVSTAELVAQLREAPTQVDRIRALNDTQVCRPILYSHLSVTYLFRFSIHSIFLTLLLVLLLVPAATLSPLHP